MRTGGIPLLSIVAMALFIASFHIVAADAATVAGSVPPEYRLSIEQPRFSGEWKGNDLFVEYQYSKDQGQMDLSGKINLSSFLVLGYSFLRDFRLGAIFLDQNGRVLKETGVVTNRGSLDPISFHRRIAVPPNAVSMAFSYQGVAIEAGKAGGHTSFSFYPIH